MSQSMNLNDGGSKFSQIVQSLSASKEACEIKNNQGQTVAIVLPVERYESYQAYLRQREKDFAVIDRVAGAFEDLDPDELQLRINQATKGYGNYTEERSKQFSDMPLDTILSDIRKMKATGEISPKSGELP